MLITGNLKMALSSIRRAKWRSLLTMLGIVIGVVSVVTTVSLGEGVKQQVVQQINQRGNDLITVLPGKRVTRNDNGSIVGFNPFQSQTSTLFSEADYRIIGRAEGADVVVPFGRVIGLVEANGGEYQEAQVIAANEGVPDILNQSVEFGSFYKDDETGRASAVIGRLVAERLFKENVPIGKSLTIRDREFIVRGVFEDFPASSPLFPGDNLNNAIFIPYDIGQELMGGNLQIYQVLVRPAQADKIEPTINNIRAALLKQRAGQEDFTILRQEENLALASDVLDLLTSLVTGIAAISLIVGGIGIMNIMFVSVTERTQEIGVRKAIGATNRQILYQFMTEATVLSLLGGLLGVLMSILANFLIRILTTFQPVITLPVILLACGVALGVGVVFGITPALKAARKDPIEALRYE